MDSNPVDVSTFAQALKAASHQLRCGERGLSVRDRIECLFEVLRTNCGLTGLERIGANRFDRATGHLHSFTGTGSLVTPFPSFEGPLSAFPSLDAMRVTGNIRVVSDIAQEWDRNNPHVRELLDRGIRSSLSVPLFAHDDLVGFLFLNSSQAHYFDTTVMAEIRSIVHLIAMYVTDAIVSALTVTQVSSILTGVARFRDAETASHMTRLGRYARLICAGLKTAWELDDEYIEYVAWCAPLHDIGKVGVPDRILLKPGRLDPAEFEEMKRHVAYGTGIADTVAEQFQVNSEESTLVLRNIIAGHHENFDGTGYPNGLIGVQIPKEARIIAVADVFDALTSLRTYKGAWSIDSAFDFLRDQRGLKFDAACVNAFMAARDQIEQIMDEYSALTLPVPLAANA
jgi:HD-GYP domain-containing protein (c-di-GMP phosphodiesterase class II)